MKPKLPLYALVNTAVPVTAAPLRWRVGSLPSGAQVVLPKGTWATFEEALNDPETRILVNGVNVK